MKYKYLDNNLPVEDRVNDLLSRMTIDEKIDQMYTTGCNEIEPLLKRYKNGEKFCISSTFVYFGFNPEKFNLLQDYQIKNNRWGIPILLACENTHGLSNPQATIYPTTGCMAATFDDGLIYQFARLSAKEARILGIRQVYAPNIDISWDQRWGRVEENFGEDPLLTSIMGQKIVQGFQEEEVAATIKHYIAYGLGEGGINLAPAHIGEREIREYMLPPFEACIKNSKAWSLMPSYNEIDGMPVHASYHLMNDILRNELQFDGMVITDYGASNMLYGFHRIVSSPVEAGKILCNNQVDMEGCSFFGYNNEFRKLVKEGKYPIDKVDECVKDILRLKFRTGLFENPYAQIDEIDKVHSKESVSISRRIAEEGIVMLKNDGVLPLKQGTKVALVGPNADIAQLGDYIYYSYFDENYSGEVVSEKSISLKEALIKHNVSVKYSLGCHFDKTNEDLLCDAVNTALDADVIILALGDNSKGGTYCGNQDGLKALKVQQTVTSGEGYDLHSIELLPPQQELFTRLSELNKPMIMILYGGRPHAITKQEPLCSAILFAFGPGEEGNDVINDILFGRVNPSGRLPISFPRSTGHLPCYYNYKPSARGSFYKHPGDENNPGKDYVFENPKALYSFGHGLSYTSFSYSDIRIEKKENSDFLVKFVLKNIGDCDGDEVVLVYVAAYCQPTTPVVKKLAAFTRVSLKKAEQKQVCITVSKDTFMYIDENMQKQYNSGRYKLMIADQSFDLIV